MEFNVNFRLKKIKVIGISLRNQNFVIMHYIHNKYKFIMHQNKWSYKYQQIVLQLFIYNY